MKLLVIGDRARTEKFLPDLAIVGETELVVVERGTSDEDILRKAEDADAILADAISPVSAKLIDGMPNLKMIHSEGVAFNAIDGEAAARRGIYVCNNRGVNAVAVAEQTLLLILGVLKHVVEGDAAVRTGSPCRDYRVDVEGGTLRVAFEPDGKGGFTQIELTGPARKVFEGEFADDFRRDGEPEFPQKS